jgi:ubiquinone/menaquinone biosynthesis C-methylase UbiE
VDGEPSPPAAHPVGAVARALGAEGYERSWIQRGIARVHLALLDSLTGRIDAPARILDVGCGTGRLLRRLGERWPGAELIGVDPDPEMAAVARRLVPSARIEVGSAESLPFESARIDLVVSSISLHHWADAQRGLAEVRRVLRTAGTLGLADLTLPRWLARLMRSGAKTPAALGALVGKAGLHLEEQPVVLARVIVVVVATRAAA